MKEWITGYVQSMPEPHLCGEEEASVLYSFWVAHYPPHQKDRSNRPARMVCLRQEDVQKAMPVIGDHVSITFNDVTGPHLKKLTKKSFLLPVHAPS